MLPLVESNPPDGYTVYVNFADMWSQGLIGDAAIITAATVAKSVFERLRVVHMTTHRPWNLKPGQFSEVRVCPRMPWIDQLVGGYTFRSCDRTPDWYTPALSYVVNTDPTLLGLRIAHEFGHQALPTFPFGDGVHVPDAHTDEPGNFMNGTRLTMPGSVTDDQQNRVAANLFRVNRGSRLITVTDPNRVEPG